MSRSRFFRYGLPAVVSVGLLAWIFSTVPLREAVASVTFEAAIWSIAAVVVFVIVTLMLEALSYARAAQGTGAVASLGTWARVKAASYAPQMVHHALGLAALTYLIRRRLGFPVLVVVGIVALIPLFDILAMLTMIALSAASPEMAGRVSLPVIAVFVAALIVGLVWLRSNVSLGPLDRLRDFGPFHAAREASLRKLIELAALRLLFTASFIALWGASLSAFGISVPPGRLALGIAIVAAASMLPSVSGFGTSQAAFLKIFEDFASPEALLGCNLFVSVMLVMLRVSLSLVFAGEFTREAFLAAQEETEGLG